MSTEQGQNIGFAAFIWGHLTASFATPVVDLSGRTVCVTGGNAGLGYETVLHFARSNASRIIIASRNIEKCQTAARKVYSDVPSYRGKVDVLQLDLSSFDSVKRFCKELNDDKDRLDYVIANAGVSKSAYTKTSEGYEETLQVNGLATGLMGLLLLPKLEETAGREIPAGSTGLKPTMVIVASEVHYWAKFAQADTTGSLIEALNDPKQFVDGMERYNMSKVLSVFNGRELAKLPAVTSGKVLVNSANPGLCVSALRDEMGAIGAWIMNAISWSAEKGSRNFLYAATQATTPGAFIHHCKETPPSNFIVSPKGQKTQTRYWTESLEIFRKLGLGEELDKALKA